MPGYLVDESGERTHAVLPLDEYERLVDSAERLDQVRGFATQMMAVVEDEEGQSGDPAGEKFEGEGLEGEGLASEESTVSQDEADGHSEGQEEPQERQGWLGR